jgi:hypothetical protein
MVETAMDSVVAELKASAHGYFPESGELRNVRVVGHTPKGDHCIYDVVVDFADDSKRIAAKLYRSGKGISETARKSAQRESENVQYAYNVSQSRKLPGVPRPVGDFTAQGAVLTEKISGLPLQSIIMKAALLPGYADQGILRSAARKAGEWLRSFHRATSDMPARFAPDPLLAELETLCSDCKGEGLDDNAIRTILSGAGSILSRNRKHLPSSAVLNDFTPLNVIVGDDGISFGEYARMTPRGACFFDVAQFLAGVEALEKYPFCNRLITAQVQDDFLDAYGASASDQALLRVLKMRALLGMFAQGRGVKESAVRKKVMWATVMKRFIQQAAQRSLAPAA